MTPTGTVSLYDGSSLAGVQNLDANGNCSFSKIYTVDGVHSLTAHYSGDANFNAAVSDPYFLTVTSGTKANVVFSLSASPNPAQDNQTVAVSVNVAAQ